MYKLQTKNVKHENILGMMADNRYRYYRSCVDAVCSIKPRSHCHCVWRPTLTHARECMAMYAEPSSICAACCVCHRTTTQKCHQQWSKAADDLMTLPRTGQLLTAAPGHTGVESRISVKAAWFASPPTMCTWTTDDLRLHWRRRAAAVVIGGS